MTTEDGVVDLIAWKVKLTKQVVREVLNSAGNSTTIRQIAIEIPSEVLREFAPTSSPSTHASVSYSDVTVESDARNTRHSEETKHQTARTKRKAEIEPQYIYSYNQKTSSLFRTTLRTGETEEARVRNYTFPRESVWCEVAGGDIYFTGGMTDSGHTNEVVRVSWSSLEVTQKAAMKSPRREHGSVYDGDYLYVIGGSDGYCMSECERLLVRKDRWEALKPLPSKCYGVSVVVLKDTQCLYALGGWLGHGGSRDIIQRLTLDRLEWDVMPLRLPSVAASIACFKQDESKLEFVVRGNLYCLNAKTECAITLIKQIGDNTRSYCGPSYYHSGHLYCSNNDGAAERQEVGSQ